MQLCFCCVQYHGGTNFGRTSGGPFITTSYDYEAPIDEYGEFALQRDHCGVRQLFSDYDLCFASVLLLGLPRLPKWGHLKNLHKAIMLSENMLIGGEHRNFSLGPSLEVDFPQNKTSGFVGMFLMFFFVSIFRFSEIIVQV